MHAEQRQVLVMGGRCRYDRYGRKEETGVKNRCRNGYLMETYSLPIAGVIFSLEEYSRLKYCLMRSQGALYGRSVIFHLLTQYGRLVCKLRVMGHNCINENGSIPDYFFRRSSRLRKGRSGLTG